MHTLLQDLRYTLRSLRRTPGFTIVAVLTLALGIGATSTIFGVVDTLFFRPPEGVRDAGSIVRVYVPRARSSARAATGPVSAFDTDYRTLHDNARALSGLAAFDPGLQFDVDQGTRAAQATGMIVSGNYFSVLGVRPALGRFFVAEEDAGLGSPPAAVVSHAFWEKHFGGDPSVVGRALSIDGYRFTIVGIAPSGFHGVDPAITDVWIPVSQMSNVAITLDPLMGSFAEWRQMVGRLAPGVTRAHARAELTAIVQNADGPQAAVARTVTLGPIFAARGPNPSQQATIARWLALAAMLVLAIACANAANLLLARAASRRREIAIRLSMGASRLRIARQLFVESITLAVLGAIAGIALAVWSVDLVPTFGLPPLHFFAHGRVLVFAIAAAILCGALFGLAPALWATRTELSTAMKDGTRAGAHQPLRLRGALVVAQVALAAVLLTGAGLFVHSLRNVQAVDPGFDLDRLVRASVNVHNMGYGDTASAAFYDRAVRRLRGLPGVEDATLVSYAPLSGNMSMRTYTIPGRGAIGRGRDGAHPGQAPTGTTLYINAGSNFLSALGMRLLRGRDFTNRDVQGNASVVIVNEAFARRAWPNERAVGQCVDIANTCWTVIGIVANAKYMTLGEQQRVAIFLPLSPVPTGHSYREELLIRTASSPNAAIPAVRHALQQLAPDLPYVELQSLTDMLRPVLQPRRLGASVFSMFGGLALVLAAVGLYGVVSYTVAQRTHEMGVRIALGAQSRHVMGLVVWQGTLLTILGLVIGIGGALASTHLITHLLFGVRATDPVTFAGVCVVLTAVALLASYVPARRAMRVDPVIALRAE